MMPTDCWLYGRNLPKPLPDGDGRLEGEAMTYALTTYLLRPGQMPDDVVVLLAEDVFGKMLKDVDC